MTHLNDIRLSQLRAGLAGGEIDVLSVDVFDTLLWRRVPEPADLFLVLGHTLAASGKLAGGVSPAGFADLRRAAERAAREKAEAATGYREIRLPDIYAQLPESLFAPDFGRAAQVDMELACEGRMVVADEALTALMSEAKAVGVCVILVSDTYFTAAQLRALLDAAGCGDLALDRIYVSTEAGRPKYRDLFDVILADLGAAPARMVHIGDNHGADVAPCAARGIGAVHYDRGALPVRAGYAAFARRDPLGERGDFGLTGLRSRLVHRPPADLPAGMGPYWRIGAGTLAPVFAGFARWIVGRCASTGVTRVFGLMREGRFLSALVEATARDLGVDLKAEEIWLSRRAVIGASLYPDDLSQLSDLIVVAPGETVEEVLSALGLTLAEVTAVIPGFDMRRPGALGALSHAITVVPFLKDKVLARAARDRRNLLRGLARHFDPRRDTALTLLDLGYAATIQTLLARILAREGAETQIKGLYFVLNDRAAANRRGGAEIAAYLDDGGFDTPLSRLLTRTPDVLEHACMCREGSLVRYDDAGAPVLLPNQRTDLQLAQMEVLQRGILAGAGAINRLLDGFETTPPGDQALKGQVTHLLEGMMLYPTPEETETIGVWHHEANLDITDRRRLIDLAFDPSALEYQGLAALAEVGRQHTYWPAAAFAHVDPFLRDAYAAGVLGLADPALFTSGPLLGGLTVTPDFGAGFDDSRARTVPLAINAFGRGEIVLTIKDAGAEPLVRVKFVWPAAQAVIAIIPPVFTCRGDKDSRGLAVNGLAWSGAKEIFQGVQLTDGTETAAIVDVGRPPPFPHAVEMTLRFKYLRLAPIFGMQ